MVPEAPLEETEAGLVPAGHGWFVVNARDARWISQRGPRHERLPLTRLDRSDEAESYFPQLGAGDHPPGARRADPGMYHWGGRPGKDFLILDFGDGAA